jgi:hypothetical protein
MSTLLLQGPIFTGEDFIDAGCAVIDQSKGTIIDVGRSGEVTEPKGARALEVQGSTILPGLIDAHVHFFGSKRHDMSEWVTTPESSLLFVLIPDVAPERLYGTVIGLYGSFEDAGVILSPTVYGLIWSLYSPVSIFAAASLSSLFAALLLLPISQTINSKLHRVEKTPPINA